MRNHKSFVLKSGLALVLGIFFVLPVSSHDPITTSVTFNKEIVRILQRHCVVCHSPGKVQGDIPLTTYDEARPWAKAIKEEVLEKRMPPYQAIKGYGDFQTPYSIPQHDIELLVSWVEGGAPRGDEKELPKETANDEWAMGKPDQIITADPAVKIEAGSGIIEKCVPLKTNFKTDQWIEAIDIRPDKSAVVLSASVILAMGKNDCSGERIAVWIPGQANVRLPEGTAWRLPKDKTLHLQIRYRQGDEAIIDETQVGLYFAFAQPIAQAQYLRITAAPLLLKARTEKQRHQATYKLTESSMALAVRPLLFPYAKTVNAIAYKPDGTAEVLIVTRGYRYDWQPSYFFKRPIELPAGTRIEVTAYLNNSERNTNLKDDPKTVKFTAPLLELTLARSLNAGSTAGSPASSSAAHKH